jgi:hypothetical protein
MGRIKKRGLENFMHPLPLTGEERGEGDEIDYPLILAFSRKGRRDN